MASKKKTLTEADVQRMVAEQVASLTGQQAVGAGVAPSSNPKPFPREKGSLDEVKFGDLVTLGLIAAPDARPVLPEPAKAPANQ